MQPHHRHQGQDTGGLPVIAKFAHSKRKGWPYLFWADRNKLDWYHSNNNKLCHIIHNWRISEESTKSDHNLIFFNLMMHNANMDLNQIACKSTTKFATQVGNWKLDRLKIQQNKQQRTNFVNSGTAKEQLDKSITEVWCKLGEISKSYIPQFSPKTKYVPWWSPKLNVLRKQVNAFKRRDKNVKTQTLKRSQTNALRILKTYTKQNFHKPNKTPGRNSAQTALKIRPGKCTKLAKPATQGNLQLHRKPF